MAIGRNFEECIQKAIRSVEYSFSGFSQNDLVEQDKIEEELRNPSDQRLFAIANAFHLDYTVDRVHELTNIDRWFLHKLKHIVDMDRTLSGFSLSSLPTTLLRSAKQIGMSDRQIAAAISTTELAVRKLRTDNGVTPFVKQIDTGVLCFFFAKSDFMEY